MPNSLSPEKKTIAVNFISLISLQAANYILPLITLPYLVIVLGVGKFGLVVLAQSICNFFLIAVNFGFDISGTREISILKGQKKDVSDVFWSITIIKTTLIVAGFIILYILVQSISRYNENSLVYYLSYGVVVGRAIFPTFFFLGIEKMKIVTYVNVTAKVLFTILIFIGIKTENDYYLVPVFNSLGFIISGIIGFLLALKHIKRFRLKIQLIKNLFSDSLSLFVGNFCTNLYTNSNVIILGFFAGDAVVGIYSSMEKIFMAMKSLFIPIYQSLFPWLSKQVREKKIIVFKKILVIVSFISVLIFIVVSLTGDYILELLYNDENINEHSYIFKTLGLVIIFSALSMAFLILLFPSEKLYTVRMKIFVFLGIFHLLISSFAVYSYGINGTLVCVVISEFLLLILCLIYYRKYLNNNINGVSV